MFFPSISNILTLSCCTLNQVLILVLLGLPGLLFFTTYTLLVLFWAEIYHQASKFSCYYQSARPVMHFSKILNLCRWININLFVTINGQARSLPSEKLRVVYISVNAWIYAIQV
jgi:hypothetical protein